MGSIYRILKALQKRSRERHYVHGMVWDGSYALHRRKLSVQLDVQPFRPFSACEPSTVDAESASSRATTSCFESSLHGFLDCLTPILYATIGQMIRWSEVWLGLVRWAGGREGMQEAARRVVHISAMEFAVCQWAWEIFVI